MGKVNIVDFIKGWFIGNFEPSLLKTDNFEVGIKEYVIGTTEPKHYHKEAVEYTIVLDGIITMNGNEYHRHDICITEKNQTNTFEAITDARVLVVKTPCVAGDKYLTE